MSSEFITFMIQVINEKIQKIKIMALILNILPNKNNDYFLSNLLKNSILFIDEEKKKINEIRIIRIRKKKMCFVLYWTFLYTNRK